MKLLTTSAIFLTSLTLRAGAEKVISKKEYVEQWRTTAVQQMIQFKIPASITMAQAILESGSGNSELALKGNNHFGIKCHDWDGDKMYMDDDAQGECFRVYASAEESYIDHSEFLTGKKRYANLFSFSVTDYEAWAKGLKEAGYATNPKYPELLTNLIKELDLDELDKLGIQNNEIKPDLVAGNAVAGNQSHAVQAHKNRVKYIRARKGDTFYRVAQEFGLTLAQLYHYNDFDERKDLLEEGDMIYIQPKRARSKTKSTVLKQDMTVNELAQLEAVKAEYILKRNDIDSPETLLKKGEKIILR
jgi:LysM repeat protein